MRLLADYHVVFAACSPADAVVILVYRFPLKNRFITHSSLNVEEIVSLLFNI